MFTRNYWLYQAAYFAGNTDLVYSATVKPKYITWSGVVGDNVYSGKEYGGYLYPYHTKSSMSNVQFTYSDFGVKTVSGYSSTSNFGGYGLVFGSGNEPATIDDYKLSGDVITGCAYSNAINHSMSDDGSEGAITATYTITNNNDEDITIGEIGLYSEMYWMTKQNTYTCYPVLWERTVLESPITIPAGGVGQVTYTIQMNYPVSVATE